MDAGSPALRVLLVDDQQLVRSGFALMLQVEDDIDVVGQAGNGREAVDLASALRPDVILMDVQMPVMDGIAATEEIVKSGDARVIILTTFDRDDYLFDGLRAGASGFLLKNSSPEHLVEAVRTVGRGHALLAPEVTMRVIKQLTDSPGLAQPAVLMPEEAEADKARCAPPCSPGATEPRLTEREHEILLQVARGLSNSEIASELFLGEATVKTHVSNCLSKLGLRDRVQLVVYAFGHGLVPSD